MPKSVNPLQRRKSSSPFTSLQRTKPGSRKSRLAERANAIERLDDIGLIPTTAPDNVAQDIVSLICHIRSSSFDDIPDRAAGMNSERISEVLRFRKGLPPIVSIAHLHALSSSTTETERELAQLIGQGKVRRVTIPGRGKGGSAVGEGVVLVEDWIALLGDNDDEGSIIGADLRQKYISLMESHPVSPTTPTTSLTDGEIRTLVSAGFLTNPAALSSSVGDLFARPGTFSSISPSSRGMIASAGSSAVTGTFAAVGGQGAVHDSGGGGSTLATKDNRATRSLADSPPTMTFSLPSMGIYLKLLTEARLHLLALLKQLSPKYREATKSSLEEKWNGNMVSDAVNMAKRARGEWTGVLPGKTKRWRDFYGLRFDWVLAECVGSGMIELFDTGSVGVGVRAT